MSPEFRRSRVKRVDTATFLDNLSTLFSLNRIYYPGCWDDTVLEKGLPIDKIVYLDQDRDCGEIERGGRRFVQGDFASAPFADATFDAVFVQDIHAEDFEMKDILRTLKPCGILIFSKNDCVRGDKDDLRQVRNHPQLRPVPLPFIHRHFSVFQKGE